MSTWGGRSATRLLAAAVAEYGLTCWLCGRQCEQVDPARPRNPQAVSVDHVVPRSRGGSNDLANLRVAHMRCNSRRGARPPRSRRGVVDGSSFFQPETR